MLEHMRVQTSSRTEMIDITARVESLLDSRKISDGICVIYVPHTTAGVTINENADPDVTRDMLMELNKLVPFEDGYRHMEGNSAAHIKASMMGFSQTVIVQKGKLLLGTWQGIYFCEFDGPRERRVLVKVLG